MGNFTVSGIKISLFPRFIIAKAPAIGQACNEILDGQLHVHFVVDLIPGAAASDMLGVFVHLNSSFEEHAQIFRPIYKIGPAQLRDAVPMTLDQEFKTFADTIRKET